MVRRRSHSFKRLVTTASLAGALRLLPEVLSEVLTQAVEELELLGREKVERAAQDRLPFLLQGVVLQLARGHVRPLPRASAGSCLPLVLRAARG